MKQTLNMGGMKHFKDNNCIIDPIKKGQNENISECNISLIYRSDEIYKECSYQLPALHLFRTKKKSCCTLDSQETNKEIPKYNVNLVAQYYWSQLNHLPALERQCKVNKDLEETYQKSSDYNFDADQFESRQVDTNAQPSHVIPTDNVGTSVDSFLKNRQPLKTKFKTWYKSTFPKLLCPCCTGGSDGGAPYHSESAAGSYESIDLKACSNSALHSLDLDASLMSIIHLHRSLKPKRTPRVCAIILGSILRNTYRNAIELISSIK